MSRLSRLLPPLAAGRRSYSFFSSKPGGGRYFNSAKPAKVIAPAKSSASGTSNVPQSNTSSSSAPELPDGPVAEEVTTVAKPSPERLRDTKAATSPAFASPLLSTDPPPFAHPTLKPHELTLHHFFALHRPYLLLNQPTSVLFESASPPQTSSSKAPVCMGTIDDPPVASPEADADSARQIGRALVLNRVGNTVNWSKALARLGQLEEAAPLPSEVIGINLDSTKRKRRKKMKKHKYVIFLYLSSSILINWSCYVCVRLKKRRRVRNFRLTLTIVPINDEYVI